MNDRVARDNAFRASWRATGKDSNGFESTKRGKWKKSKAPAVTAVGGPHIGLIGVNIQESAANQVTVAEVPVALPIRQFRSKIVEISDPERKLLLSSTKAFSNSPLK